jgi:hypothetical protein
MSSVWLTARAVRYITCRLLRARASQRPCPSSGVAIAIESSSRMDRTIREPSISLVGGTMSTSRIASSAAASRA